MKQLNKTQQAVRDIISAHGDNAKAMRWEVKSLGLCPSPWSEDASVYGFICILGGEIFNYYMGIGHAVVKNKGHYMERTIAPTPCEADLLYSLIADDTQGESFPDWCDNYGYDTVSRKALDIYLTCQDNTRKLRKAFSNHAAGHPAKLEAIKELLQDY